MLDLAASPTPGGSEVVSQVCLGQEVRATGRSEGDFVEVKAAWGGPDQVERGWLEAAGVSADAPASADRWVTSTEALAYAAPTRRAGGPLERLPLAAPLGSAKSADREQNGFFSFTVRGRIIWVQTQDLVMERPRAESVRKRITVATSLLGRPYVWGGCTSLGLDCSGLAKLLASLTGVGLPHSAAKQAALETERFVSINGLPAAEPGDFLYLRPARAGSRVDHVVMLGHAGGVLHASAEGGPPAVRCEDWHAVAPRGEVASVRRLLDR